jgi:hypothetical protein
MALRVPWAVVPRGTSNIWGELSGYSMNGSDAEGTLAVHNGGGGVHGGYADIFQWGLQDQREGYDGIDIRAVGVQTLPKEICDPGAADGDVCLNVAINNWTRYSNASENLYLIEIDVDGDETIDYEIYSVDAAQLLGTLEGITISAVYDVAADSFGNVYLATAPTNSSTLMLPFLASDIGLDPGGDTDFQYYAVGVDFYDDDGDPGNPVLHQDVAFTASHPGTADQLATYDAFDPVLSNSQFAELPPNTSANIPVSVDLSRYDPLAGEKGWMLVTLDDPSGERQADLFLVGPTPPYVD